MSDIFNYRENIGYVELIREKITEFGYMFVDFMHSGLAREMNTCMPILYRGQLTYLCRNVIVQVIDNEPTYFLEFKINGYRENCINENYDIENIDDVNELIAEFMYVLKTYWHDLWQ